MGITQVTAVIGAVSGLSGLALGILNYLHQRDKSRPRLVVRPYLLCMGEVKDGKEVTTWQGIIEVRNTGHVPVVGATVGFLPGWRWRLITAVTKHLPRHIRESTLVWSLQRNEWHSVTVYQEEPVRKGLEWQQEIAPQHIAMVRFNPVLLRAQPPLIPEEPRIGRAYARTVVGDVFRASRRDMRRFIQQVEEFRLSQPLPGTPCASSPTSQPRVETPTPDADATNSPLPQ